MRGEMSFVGPRPIHIEHHLACPKEIPRFSDRLPVRPGLSGLAQVYLKRDCGPRARYHYDILYVRRASSLGDLKIVWLSLLDVMTFRLGRGHRRPLKLRQR